MYNGEEVILQQETHGLHLCAYSSLCLHAYRYVHTNLYKNYMRYLNLKEEMQ